MAIVLPGTKPTWSSAVIIIIIITTTHSGHAPAEPHVIGPLDWPSEAPRDPSLVLLLDDPLLPWTRSGGTSGQVSLCEEPAPHAACGPCVITSLRHEDGCLRGACEGW